MPRPTEARPANAQSSTSDRTRTMARTTNRDRSSRASAAAATTTPAEDSVRLLHASGREEVYRAPFDTSLPHGIIRVVRLALQHWLAVAEDDPPIRVLPPMPAAIRSVITGAIGALSRASTATSQLQALGPVVDAMACYPDVATLRRARDRLQVAQRVPLDELRRRYEGAVRGQLHAMESLFDTVQHVCARTQGRAQCQIQPERVAVVRDLARLTVPIAMPEDWACAMFEVHAEQTIAWGQGILNPRTSRKDAVYMLNCGLTLLGLQDHSTRRARRSGTLVPRLRHILASLVARQDLGLLGLLGLRSYFQECMHCLGVDAEYLRRVGAPRRVVEAALAYDWLTNETADRIVAEHLEQQRELVCLEDVDDGSAIASVSLCGNDVRFSHALAAAQHGRAKLRTLDGTAVIGACVVRYGDRTQAIAVNILVQPAVKLPGPAEPLPAELQQRVEACALQSLAEVANEMAAQMAAEGGGGAPDRGGGVAMADARPAQQAEEEAHDGGLAAGLTDHALAHGLECQVCLDEMTPHTLRFLTCCVPESYTGPVHTMCGKCWLALDLPKCPQCRDARPDVQACDAEEMVGRIAAAMLAAGASVKP